MAALFCPSAQPGNAGGQRPPLQAGAIHFRPTPRTTASRLGELCSAFRPDCARVLTQRWRGAWSMQGYVAGGRPAAACRPEQSESRKKEMWWRGVSKLSPERRGGAGRGAEGPPFRRPPRAAQAHGPWRPPADAGGPFFSCVQHPLLSRTDLYYQDHQ